MSKTLKTIITYTITFALSGFLVWFSVKNLSSSDIHAIKEAIAKSNKLLLIPIVIMGFLSHWSRAKRWRYLMQPLGYKPSTANTLFAIMVGYFANLGLPRFGEVLKCTLLARYEKIPADKLVGTIITERAFDVLSLLIVFFITFIIQIDFSVDYLSSLYKKWNNQESGNSYLLWIILALLFCGVFFFFFFKKKILASSIFQKVKTVFLNIWAGIMSFKTMENKLGFLFHSIFIWAMYYGMVLLGFQCLEATQHLGVKPACSVLAFGSIGMIATPGGIGAYILIVNEIVQLYGITKIFSNAISWIVWLVPTAILIVGGVISLLLLPLYNKSKNA